MNSIPNQYQKVIFLLLLSFSIVACQQKENKTVAVSPRGIDLEKIDFKEDPLIILKGKIDSNAGGTSSGVSGGFSEAFDYPVAYKFEPWNGDESLYGKAYYSKLIDSIAHYKNIAFNSIAFLVHNNKTVAILADAEIKSDTVYNDFIKQLTKQFGAPSFSPQTTVDKAYEWSGKDRCIQIDYSTGASMTAVSDKAPVVTKTFNMQLLIFEKTAALEIKKIQEANYAKSKDYKVMPGDFKLYKNDPQTNIVLADSLLNEKFK